MLKLLKDLIIGIAIILSPIHTVIFAMLGMVAADFITGVWAAKHRKEPITSAGFKQTLIKTMIYLICIICGFFTEQYLTLNLIPLTKIISGFIGLTEMKSLLENLDEISGDGLLKLLIDTISKKANK